jgi:hypothetical protein
MGGIAQFVLIAKRTLQEFRALGRTVNTGLLGLQQHIKTIAEDSKSHKNPANVKDAEPCNVLVSKLALPEAVEEYYKSHTDDRPRGKWGWVRFCMEAGGLVALVVYVIITGRTLNETRKQVTAAQHQLDVMRSAQRPWIGIFGTMSLSSEPVFKVRTRSISVTMEGVYTLKNFGTAPAFNVASNVMLWIPADVKESANPPDEDMILCLDSTIPGKGEILFPGSPGIIQGFSQVSGRTIPGKTINEVAHMWIIGCVSYQDGTRTIHHTRFWFRTAHPDGANWIHLGAFQYMPTTGFESWGEKAD